MRSLIPFFIAVLVTTSLFGQAPDSISRKYDSVLNVNKTRYESESSRINGKIDSVQGKIKSLTNPDLNFASRFRKYQFKPSDSLQALNEFDSLKGGLTHKIDSLKGLNLPTGKYTRKLDSLEQLGPQKYVQQAKQRKQQIEDKVNKPLNAVQNEVNDKLNLMRKEGGDGANIPGDMKLNGASIPGVDSPDLKIPSADVNLNNPLSKVDNPLGKIDNPVKDQLGELNEKATDLKSIPQAQIDKVKSIDQVQTAKDKVGSLNQATDKVQAYEGDVKNIAQGNISEVKQIPEAIENKAASLDEIKELQKQTGEIDKAKEMVAMGNDPEALKDMAKQQVMKQATDHFAGKEQVLKAAMDKMSKLKSKYSEVKSLADLPKRPPNPMKNKPLIERFVPGLTLQFQKESNFMVDINPVIGYRINGHISAGLGWNERLSFAKWNKLNPADRIYGPRAFGSYMIKKGWGVKAELEKMNAVIPPFAISPDAGTRQWLWSAFVGIKKDYKFIGKVNGNVQILYNLYDDHDNSPYADKLNVRMGFEFPVKKKKRVLKG